MNIHILRKGFLLLVACWCLLSAGPYELNEKEKAGDKADEIKMNAGSFYRKMHASVQEVLGKLDELHPDYDSDAGYEISGFVWFQGFNDQFSPEFRDSYASNMNQECA